MQFGYLQTLIILTNIYSLKFLKHVCIWTKCRKELLQQLDGISGMKLISYKTDS